jgi:hypothetical protein
MVLERLEPNDLEDRCHFRRLRRASSLDAPNEPPPPTTERCFGLTMEATRPEAAGTNVEKAVHGIHSHMGLYFIEEVDS